MSRINPGHSCDGNAQQDIKLSGRRQAEPRQQRRQTSTTEPQPQQQQQRTQQQQQQQQQREQKQSNNSDKSNRNNENKNPQQNKATRTDGNDKEQGNTNDERRRRKTNTKARNSNNLAQKKPKNQSPIRKKMTSECTLSTLPRRQAIAANSCIPATCENVVLTIGGVCSALKQPNKIKYWSRSCCIHLAQVCEGCDHHRSRSILE